MNIELIHEENAKEWTFEEAVQAWKELGTLERQGVWDRPAWAEDIAKAWGRFDMVNVVLIGRKRVIDTFAKELGLRGV